MSEWKANNLWTGPEMTTSGFNKYLVWGKGQRLVNGTWDPWKRLFLNQVQVSISDWKRFDLSVFPYSEEEPSTKCLSPKKYIWTELFVKLQVII